MKSTCFPRWPLALLGFVSAQSPALLHAQSDDGEIIVEEDTDDEETASEVEANDEPSAAATEPEAEVVVEEKSEDEPKAPAAETKTEEPAPAAETKTEEPTPAAEPEDVPLSPRLAPSDEQLAAQAEQAALVDAPSKQDSLLPLKLSTSTFSRFEYREGYDDLGVSRGRFSEGDAVVFRARLGIRTNPLPIADGSDVLVQFSPQASGVWGVTGTTSEVNLGIYEGYVLFRSQRLEVELGRFKMNYGDSLIIGDLDWHQAGRAFDGLRAHYKMKRGYLDLFATQVAAGGPDAGPKLFAGDDLFWGAYLGVGEYLGKGLDLDAYFLGLSNFAQEGLVDAETGVDYSLASAHLFTAGLRAKQKMGFFDYRLEGDVQFGRTIQAPPPGFTGDHVDSVQTFAYQADVEFGFMISSTTRLGVGAVLASGDAPASDKNEGFNELYPTGHKFLGLMDVIGARTNVGSANLKVTQNLGAALKAQVDAHVFTRLEDGGLGSVAGAGLAGTEIDTQLGYALGKYANVRGLYGLFIPATGHYASDDLAHYVEVEAGVRF